ncbi:hypothetical protein ALC57_15337 [Trachymyrmex cornetzi]|uniref:Uncharacterized protein n=1 Tax=Trachymyrmex cornetzi TaxID=471704 RepID=A0A195DJE1_9HYME|nr:hypothetical protein ALC57_15337 [Trachymyrmex cornetzi]
MGHDVGLKINRNQTQRNFANVQIRVLAHARAHSRASSLTSYLGNANTVLCYALCVATVLWFTEKDNRPARSLWRHYPVRLESIFSTRCGNDCAVLKPGRPAGRPTIHSYNTRCTHEAVEEKDKEAAATPRRGKNEGKAKRKERKEDACITFDLVSAQACARKGTTFSRSAVIIQPTIDLFRKSGEIRAIIENAHSHATEKRRRWRRRSKRNGAERSEGKERKSERKETTTQRSRERATGSGERKRKSGKRKE